MGLNVAPTGAGLATFKRIMEAETNGEVTVDITWNIMDEGRPNTDLFELVEAGEMFFCYFSTSYQGRRVPRAQRVGDPVPLRHPRNGPFGSERGPRSRL